MPAWLRAAGVAVAVAPVSTFVVNLVPWWRSSAPLPLFLAGLAVVVALLTAGALWAGGRRPLGALRLVAVATLVVLAGDVLTGSGLQLGSVFGQNPVVGGRFYGLGNTSFALYGLAVLVVVGWVAASGRSRRRVGGAGARGARGRARPRGAALARAPTSAARPGCCSVGWSSSPRPPGCA